MAFDNNRPTAKYGNNKPNRLHRTNHENIKKLR